MGLGIPPLNIKILLESNPLKSIILVYSAAAAAAAAVAVVPAAPPSGAGTVAGGLAGVADQGEPLV